MAVTRDPRIEPHPNVGIVFDMRKFDRPSTEGIAAGCQLTGWFDFPHGGYRCWVEDGLQKVEISRTAPTKGDAGIERHVKALPGELYRLTSRVRVVRKSRGFKARVNLAARRVDGSQVAEFNGRQEEVTERAVERVAEAVIPRGVAYLSARIKFHTSKPGESGEGEVHSMMLERLK
jgi:hypothetical protein